MFTFTPLQGAKSDSTAVQSILELDGGVKVLVDVGWDQTFDPQMLKELEKYGPAISSLSWTNTLTHTLDKSQRCLSSSSRMRRYPTSAHLLIVANTFRFSRAYPYMRPRLSSR